MSENIPLTSYTVTCNRPLNYGAVLQTYALNKALVYLGVDAKVLDYNPPYFFRSNKALPVRILRAIVRFADIAKGKRVFGKFLQDYVPMSERTYTSLEEIRAFVPKADVFIAGSDQIWNCRNLENGKDDTFFLTFAPTDAKKISYAASLAMQEIPTNQKERYKKNISAFDFVSVREKTGVELLNKLGIENVSNVIDPVFLLDKDKWDQVASGSNFNRSEPYILVYGYNRQKNVYEYARRLAKKLDVKVYAINTAIEDYTLDVDKYFWNASPNTFIKLIRGAEAVVTNSFHGTAFSILYNRPFHFFTVGQTTNSRMLDLLSELELSSRHVLHDEQLLSNVFDYSVTDKLILQQREHAFSFLKHSIGV